MSQGRALDANSKSTDDEAVLAQVKADGLAATVDEWCMRFSAATGSRRTARLLEVDEAVKRDVLERALFAQQGLALGRVCCRDCAGSSKEEPLSSGTHLVPTSCDACNGSGFTTSPASSALRP